MLVLGADRFVEGASAIARNFNVSPLIIGLTIVAFGTSAPEILVSITAAINGNTPLALGNAIGSNITNIALVLGATALITPLFVQTSLLKREFPILILVTAASVAMLLDGKLDRTDGLLLVGGSIALTLWMIRLARQPKKVNSDEFDFSDDIPDGWSTRRALFWFITGLAVLLIGARALVWGGVGLATELGVSEAVVGLTIVAIGTSLPELAASVASALKKQPDMAIGNILGSNLFNLLAVLGIAGIIAPTGFDSSIIHRDLPVLASLTLVLLLMAYGFRGPGRLNRVEGALLLGAFVGYELLIYFTA